MPQRPTKPIPLVGGMDVVTAPLAVRSGRIQTCKNYEGHPRGYGRFRGFERYDGRPKPSEASYWVLNFDAAIAAVTEGQTVTGLTSGATGKALIDGALSSGGYGTGGAGYLVLTSVSGTFQDNEAIQVGGVTKATANGTATERGALTSANDTLWYRDAIETARALITAVPGSGAILGVWAYNGVRYAFRNAVGGLSAALYKATTAGWTQVTLSRSVAFTSGGVAEITEGQTITGATSGATATVGRVVLTSGSWAAGDAAGTFWINGQVGTFQAENLNVGASLNLATIGGNSVATTLSPSGRYEFQNYNFGGSTATYRMYGCDGVNKAFEFDGTTFVQISTGMTTDTPKHILAHKKHLLLGFPKGSLQISSIREPLQFDAVTGSDEIGIGEEITGIIGPYAGAAIVLGRNTIAILYGSDSDTWDLVEWSKDSGAVEWTAQILGQPIFQDDGGVRDLSSANKFGDFNVGTLTSKIKKILDRKKADGVTAVASMRCRDAVRYRLFFSDNSFLSIYFGRETPDGKRMAPECFMGDLGKRVYACCASEESETGTEVLMFGDADGMVYELDKGTSLDGATLEAYVRLVYNNLGSSTLNKAWKGAVLECDVSPMATLVGSAEYGYADTDQPANRETELEVAGGGGLWDIDLWDEFYFDAPEVGTAKFPLEGLGTNVSLAIYSSQIYEEPHVLHGVTYHFAPRGLVRP